jgi:hypothetical protein
MSGTIDKSIIVGNLRATSRPRLNPLPGTSLPGARLRFLLPVL